MALMLFGLVSAISFLVTIFPEARITQISNLLITNPDLILEQGATVRALNVPLTFVNLSYFGLSRSNRFRGGSIRIFGLE